ncbi:MAG: RNA 2'-phosphotransferase [Pseudomonadota bacterium]
MKDPNIRISKFLSLVLRHAPETIAVSLDKNGWIDVDTLLAAAEAHGTSISRERLDELVYTNDKQRFAFSDDGSRIRANQGHSVDVDLELVAVAPPAQLFHGTATRFLDSILESGIQSQSRQHVHLSGSAALAQRVGARHGNPVTLIVQSAQMHADGMAFYLSRNGVWLTAEVPVEYFELPKSDAI